MGNMLLCLWHSKHEGLSVDLSRPGYGDWLINTEYRQTQLVLRGIYTGDNVCKTPVWKHNCWHFQITYLSCYLSNCNNIDWYQIIIIVKLL